MTREEMQASPVALAYAAGLFDGEGCVQARMEGRNLFTFIQLGNADFRVLFFFHDMFGGRISEVKKTKYRNMGYWSISGKNAEHFAQLLIDYSIVKRDQLEAFLELRALVGTVKRGRGSTMDSEDLAKRKMLVLKIKELKYENYDLSDMLVSD